MPSLNNKFIIMLSYTLKLHSSNIKSGVKIFNVTGSMVADTGLLNTNLSYTALTLKDKSIASTLTRPLKFAILQNLYISSTSSNVCGYLHYYVVIPSGGKVYAFGAPDSYISDPTVNVLEFDPASTTAVNIKVWNNGSYHSMTTGGSTLSWDSALTSITVGGLRNFAYGNITNCTCLLIY